MYLFNDIISIIYDLIIWIFQNEKLAFKFFLVSVRGYGIFAVTVTISATLFKYYRFITYKFVSGFRRSF